MKPKLKVWIVFPSGTKFGEGRAELLRLVGEEGSLKRAVERMGMSYRAAWGSLRELERHPKVGASWEGFALEVVLATLGARAGDAYFWATHAGAELDLLVVRGRQRLGFEFKRTSSPTVTASMRIAMHDLKLQQLTVVHAGAESFDLDRRIRAVPLPRVLSEVRPLT